MSERKVIFALIHLLSASGSTAHYHTAIIGQSGSK